MKKKRYMKKRCTLACFAGTLSDGLGKTMDNRHQSEREYIRYHGATSGEHLVAGIHGLAHGIIGGLTSVITSTVEGVKTEGGVSGFFSGLGKGLVGTVTKPVAGALDFASETAQTVRDMASLDNHSGELERAGVGESIRSVPATVRRGVQPEFTPNMCWIHGSQWTPSVR
ncbi:vacuolar protein sorting-associated protein 13D isoform X1 [Tachysurus ichikawai]